MEKNILMILKKNCNGANLLFSALETLLSIISENKEITIVVNGKNNLKKIIMRK
jgi:hypothetical protein